MFLHRYYCPKGQSEKEPQAYFCQVGHFCPNGSAAQRPCPINKMANYTHAVECDLCPAGFYCLKSGIPIECEKGFYCPAGTGKDLRPCPRGTYGMESGYDEISDCQPCPEGKYCEQENATLFTGLCAKGHWCYSGVDRSKPIGANTTANNTLNSTCGDWRETGYGGICPVGHFCIEGSSKSEPCAIGTYAPKSGMDVCYDCVKGFYCPDTSMSTYQTYVCPTGNYCPGRSSRPTLCPVGTFSNTTGNTHIGDCKGCPRGRYCPVEGML